jgi:hypothetical protein
MKATLLGKVYISFLKYHLIDNVLPNFRLDNVLQNYKKIVNILSMMLNKIKKILNFFLKKNIKIKSGQI